MRRTQCLAGLLALFLFAGLLASGCSGSATVAEAIVLERQERSLLVYLPGSGVCTAGLDDAKLVDTNGNPATAEDFAYGTPVAITFSGMIQESYPGGMVGCTRFAILKQADAALLAQAEEHYAQYVELQTHDALVYEPAPGGGFEAHEVRARSFEDLFAAWHAANHLGEEIELVEYSFRDNGAEQTLPAGSDGSSTIAMYTVGNTVWVELTLSPASAAALERKGPACLESLVLTTEAWHAHSRYETRYLTIRAGDTLLYTNER